MSEPKPKEKPFAISKQVVWDAYVKVKANQGAAGVDGESIAEFEENLRGNLYKLWNRLSSGSYFPPPVRAVEIPKKAGGTRTLGVPVSSRSSMLRRRHGSYGKPSIVSHPGRGRPCCLSATTALAQERRLPCSA